MDLKLSIIICTYNRQELLIPAIHSLFQQKGIDPDAIEVIIIDNNSTDNTKALVHQLKEKYTKLLYFREQQQGLSFARNRGCKEAKGEYVAYFDDDALAPRNWVESALNIIEKYRPDAFGGPIYPFYLNEKPIWFKDEYEIRIHQKNTGRLNKGNYLSGSNMFFKRSLLEEFKGFDTTLGMSGEKIAYGEETELVMRLHKAEKDLYYDHKLIIKHLVPEFKQHLSYFFYKQIKQVQTLSSINNENEFYDPLSSLIESHGNVDKLVDAFCSTYENKTLDENRMIQSILPLLNNILLHHEKSKLYYTRKRKLSDKILDLNLRKLLTWLKTFIN